MIGLVPEEEFEILETNAGGAKPMSNHRSFYTDLTRAREAALVVTDSARRLSQLVRSDQTKSAALDVVGSMGPGAIASEREHG
jgi:hypothetical protein